MNLRASDPCRLLVLSRNAADVTGHAHWPFLPSHHCQFGEGHLAWVYTLPQQTLLSNSARNSNRGRGRFVCRGLGPSISVCLFENKAEMPHKIEPNVAGSLKLFAREVVCAECGFKM